MSFMSTRRRFATSAAGTRQCLVSFISPFSPGRGLTIGLHAPHKQTDWDWSLENAESGGSWVTSPVFDVSAGFGGNGAKVNTTAAATPTAPTGNALWDGLVGILESLFNSPAMVAMRGTGGGCVESGPFRNITLHIGPAGAMKPNNTRCLVRNFVPGSGESASRAMMKGLLAAKTFGQLRSDIEFPPPQPQGGGNHGGGFHSIGHGAVGGEVSVFCVCVAWRRFGG
jgi:hypothetical protein